MSIGISARVGPIYFRKPLHPGRGIRELVMLPVYLFWWTFVALWWVLKWTAVATYLAGLWIVTTLAPVVRRRWEARQAQRLTPPAG